MCYYNGQKVTHDEYIRLRHLEKLVANYKFLNRDVVNGFDFGNTVVLKPMPGKEDFEIVQMEWGFLGNPFQWPFIETRQQALQIRQGYTDSRGYRHEPMNFLNAMSEELLLKNKVYREAAIERRCLILSSGYYEWRHFFPLNKRTKLPRKTSVAYPYRIYLNGKEYFFLAGIWNPWTDYDTGETIDTVSMVTTGANFVNAQIHNKKERQPTALTADLALEWMFMKPNEKRVDEIARYQLPWEPYSWYTLAKKFLDSIEPLKEVFYTELPPIITPGMENFVPEGAPLSLF